jgi:ApaG protein
MIFCMKSRHRLSVSVLPRYLPEESDAAQGVYAYAYTVTVVNEGEIPAQLVARRWLITDAAGRSEEVRGLGVVGKQPLLRPGEAFEYTSWTRLATPHGRMAGSYYCISEDAHWFEAEIPAFELHQAHALH